jgi:uncharacterized protein (DUF983 family)
VIVIVGMTSLGIANVNPLHWADFQVLVVMSFVVALILLRLAHGNHRRGDSCLWLIKFLGHAAK